MRKNLFFRFSFLFLFPSFRSLLLATAVREAESSLQAWDKTIAADPSTSRARPNSCPRCTLRRPQRLETDIL